jgi:cytochrome P450 family 135
MRQLPLPPGPAAGPLAQTVALHRDPLGALRAAQARHGEVFTLRLATARPVVVVAARGEVEGLLHADPGAALAGSARRRILPFASPRSIFGGDGAVHDAARGRLAALFEPASLERQGAAMAAIAERHAAAWPRGRPFGLLHRMRALVDEVFVRLLLGVGDDRRAGALVAALRRTLWTPGNPPLSVPGEGNGLAGAAVRRLFERRSAALVRLIAEEVDVRRCGEPGDQDVIGRIVQADPSRPGEDVADELLVLLAEAQEPPAAALTWLLDRLAREPPLRARFADGAPVDRDRVVRETLRLNPPAIAALRRLAAAREVGGHRLPAGVVVMVPIPLLHRDPRAWAEPDAFRPDRWRAGEASRSVFLPFGDGVRRCLGEHMARACFDRLVPAILRRAELRAVWPRPERMVLRGTSLVPQRSGLVTLR